MAQMLVSGAQMKLAGSHVDFRGSSGRDASGAGATAKETFDAVVYVDQKGGIGAAMLQPV